MTIPLDATQAALATCGQPFGAWVMFFGKPCVYDAQDSQGQHQFLLKLKARRGRLERDVLGIWAGPAAQAWMARNRHEVKPGRSLLCTFSDVASHMRDGRAEQHVYLDTVELLPHGHGGAEAPAAASTTAEAAA